MPRIVVVSPPFDSHAAPLATLAGALGARGAEVYFACAEEFAHLARGDSVTFVPLTVTRNANTGVAEATRQPLAEAARLGEFLEATRAGAVPTLLTQARHRRADMLSDPEGVLRKLRVLDERLRPDWYVTDQLSFAVTLALHCLGAPYATFCPGHPTYLPAGPEAYFGVPYDWPQALRPGHADANRLLAAARENDLAFTSAFHEFVRRHAPSAPAPGRAFALTSPHAVVHGYPDLPWLPRPATGPARLFAGHMVPPHSPPLDTAWLLRLERLRRRAERIVLVAFGTFLSARGDVLRTVIKGLLDGLPDVGVIAAAGSRSPALADLAGDRAVIAATVPQQSLLNHVDAMVHHGGGNSFTECLRAGVPALVLPFSSDQFAVARDAERLGAGVVADPNTLKRADVRAALDGLREPATDVPLSSSPRLRSRGPVWAAAQLLRVMAESAPGR
ncbi:glycosyltransferase [Streptomyces sp. NPDC058576]|uniref:glycosyltransferase n=1 Tax=Streptomyces sp. NPDC058576 TaxID=3346547 RepID=UPI003648491C